jgi:hypothetical protein
VDTRALLPLGVLVGGMVLVATMACGDTLVDHNAGDLIAGPDGGPGVACGLPDAGTHLCGNACVEESEGSCGSTCEVCSAAPMNGGPACVEHLCSFECNPGFLRCGSGCCRVTEVAAGADHSCAIAGGGLKCWGKNDQGQLGRTGGASSIPTPVDVEGLTSSVTLVGAGVVHTCAVHAGVLSCFGADDSGQLGRGSPGGSSDVPTSVAGGLPGVTAIALGDKHSCALAGGGVSCWGANDRGQLGGVPATATPTAVPGLGSGITGLASGLDHVCAIRGGDVLCWGSNSSGQLGRVTGGGSSPTPTALGLTNVVALALGDAHSCALSRSGSAAPTLYCWGDNSRGQLGVSGSPITTPTEVPLGTAQPTLLAAGTQHTCFAQGDPGGMRCLGDNAEGQLGVASGSGPVPLPGLPYAIAAGGDHTCAVQTDGLLFCWGANDDGEVGNPTACGSSCSTPTEPAGL